MINDKNEYQKMLHDIDFIDRYIREIQNIDIRNVALILYSQLKKLIIDYVEIQK